LNSEVEGDEARRNHPEKMPGHQWPIRRGHLQKFPQPDFQFCDKPDFFFSFQNHFT
jgi:hypothetical protein